ncbi:MAG: alkaline phosphatase family protein [Gaiellaceae bacterium MAG52_C11]|nr:alkaline phosphatase family protein [Candidatus Gaiellasilicea maunaloa]
MARPTGRATKLILIVIDGLTPSMFEQVVGDGSAPALALLASHGTYRRAISTFPSLTPVCLSALATGAHPDVHEIPHLVWYHRGEERLVEYGSSFGAVRAAGTRRSLQDTVYELNASHLGKRAVTVYEALEDAGLTAAAVNITCYRGRTPHLPTLPILTRPAYGPKRFFFYNLFESDATGAPLSVRNRPAGTIDAYAGAVARWLVTRDGFDLLVYYLSDYDYASHVQGPDAAHETLGRCDEAVASLIAAAGGEEEFLERYAVVLCADHGQTSVSEVARLADVYPELLVTASNRAGMIYAPLHSMCELRPLAERLDGHASVDVVLYREDGEAIARREGEELRFAREGDRYATSGDASILDHPNGLERAWAALANPNAGELLVSAAPGWEFADLAGRHHSGGGSHGSLVMGDSEVPMLTVGLDLREDAEPRSITDVMPLALEHFGVPLPSYVRR